MSGDAAGQVLVWDLVKLRPIRALHILEAPIDFVAVHAKTGGLMASAANTLAVWTINGSLVAVSPQDDSGVAVPAITSLAHSFGDEWDDGGEPVAALDRTSRRLICAVSL